MRKRLIAILFTMFMAVAPAIGQVIYLDEDVSNLRKSREGSELGVMVPLQGQNYDQWTYVPLDGGIFLLAGLGLAYLKTKHKK